MTLRRLENLALAALCTLAAGALIVAGFDWPVCVACSGAAGCFWSL